MKAFATHRGLDELNVEDVGTMNNIVTIRDEEQVSKAAALMCENNIRHLVVVDKDGLLVGVISIRDIIRIEELLKLTSMA